jgi:CO/xanthine dehydrogenase Mo-binding subunit
VWGDSIGVYTNRPPGSAYRGFGMQEIHWALEQQMDIVAREIGMDPVEFRLLNCLSPGKRTVTGQVLDAQAGRVDLCIKRVSADIDMDPRRTRTPYRGRGIACAVKAPAMPNDASSSVVLKFAEDATLEVLISGIDCGQGLKTVAAQFAAESLDLPIESIRVRGNPNTDFSPYDWQTVASRQTWATGNAILKAGEDLKRQLFAMASEVLQVAPGALECRNGEIVHRATSRAIPLTRLVMGYSFPDGHTIGGPVAAAASFVPEGVLLLDPETSQSAKPVAKWTFGAQAVEVAVDPETGQYRVERVAACYDVGRVVNPGLIRGQTYGGIVQGLGTAMMEELVVDRTTGRVVNASLTDYKIPSTEDLPPEILISYLETPQADGPLGARGIGEHTMIPTPAALANAIFDACGIRITTLPITAEKVLAALKQRGSEAGAAAAGAAAPTTARVADE